MSKDIDAYIQNAPEESRAALQDVRAIIKKAAPKAEETIAYMMPAFKLDGKPLIYFAGYKKHLGLYAMEEATRELAPLFAQYKSSKGAIQFPLDEKMPKGLITKIVKFRLALLAKAAKAAPAKKKKKAAKKK